MIPLRQHMIAALHLRGKSERTQASSVREVHLLAQFSHTSPDRISEQELQHDFLHRKHVDGLPPVLSVEEVKRRLQAATPFHNQASCTTVYSLGLRLHEARFLQVSAIDGQRLQVQVQRGKGAKDRDVPLPAETLTLLRTSWKTHRHPTGLLPATGRDHPQSPMAASPMSRSRVQGAFRKATHRAGLTKPGVAPHTLRHSYATHVLEAGVHPRLIQRSLGHTPLETTMLSLHLTHTGQEEAYERRNALMDGLLP